MFTKMYSKNYLFKFVKTTYNLEQREHFRCWESCWCLTILIAYTKSSWSCLDHRYATLEHGWGTGRRGLLAGTLREERTMRQQERERRKQQSRDKIQRIKKRARQKTLGKYIKPPPDDTARSNHTLTVDLYDANSFLRNLNFLHSLSILANRPPRGVVRR